MKEVGDTGFGLLAVRLPIYFFLRFRLASSAQTGADYGSWWTGSAFYNSTEYAVAVPGKVDVFRGLRNARAESEAIFGGRGKASSRPRCVLPAITRTHSTLAASCADGARTQPERTRFEEVSGQSN